jgi:hypothetical protein
MRDLPRPISVAEALRETGIDITVPEGASVVAGPFQRQHHEAFRLAEVTSFKDLHLLGFVHPQVSEERVAQAIRKDDRDYLEWTRNHGAARPTGCSCDEAHARPEVSSAVVGRRKFHNNLAELLQPLFRATLAVDDPAVVHTYHHASRYLASARFAVGIYRLRDINIADNATLTMTPTVHAVYANDVNMGRNARFRFTSGGVHVRSRTLNGPSLVLDSVSAVAAKGLRGLARETKET